MRGVQSKIPLYEDMEKKTTMSNDARQAPIFNTMRQSVIETRTPSISLAQRTFQPGYSRASAMLAAMKGDVVTTMNARGARRMLTETTTEYL